jgi:hypothetical protein
VRRRTVAALVALGTVVLWVSPAAADPAGPTDYRTVIESIDPPVAGIDLRIVGGDSFLELTASGGVEVLVVGYQGEPYLRFGADGTVEENRRAPTTHLNQDRYGTVEPPPGASADAPPEWSLVTDGGRYAWHDHRIHWMNPQRPPGASPGDQILEAVVPIVVDGEPVEIAVSSTWLPGPSPVPSAVGAAVGAALALGVRAAFGRGGDKEVGPLPGVQGGGGGRRGRPCSWEPGRWWWVAWPSGPCLRRRARR